MSSSAKVAQTVTRAGPVMGASRGALSAPVVQLSLTELATVAMLVEGAHTMNSEQSRLALAREDVLSSALRQLKRALVEAGAVQDGPGWRPRAD